ncbi:sporulation histidine kinase inhibitor Sda [Alkalihalobacterium chitinilyticum]|uniref:Sporulation histidine kinase inhibitor Sda n=1 Tax=Alkalihalobacterium chitinilyticum TaxID=2980103 RepID=A0ABT5VK64_9BACI|nr:sporulation histidine kinase inhibitor Sda [Alkalihalobacterium chitinilyticum]MDE5415697.1 sporulation histidine kinase inhibitor Sda [Alkalihalobacterium chitinilyticum]
MYHIDNELLLEVYAKALELELDEDFITLLKEELEERELLGSLTPTQADKIKVLHPQC